MGIGDERWVMKAEITVKCQLRRQLPGRTLPLPTQWPTFPRCRITLKVEYRLVKL